VATAAVSGPEDSQAASPTMTAQGSIL
jgi:hypothetical protein